MIRQSAHRRPDSLRLTFRLTELDPHFKIMINILDKTFVPFISRETIEKRIAELASGINSDYADSCPVFIVVLNGAFLFASELVKKI